MPPPVAITRVTTARPQYRIDSGRASTLIGAAVGDARRAAAIARGSRIRERALALSPDAIGKLGSIEERNAVYRRVAPLLALEVSRGALSGIKASTVGCLASSSCTGYMVPGWDVEVAQACGLPREALRIPVTQAGCSGGVVALSLAAAWARQNPGRPALAAAVELCSLAFQADPEPGNLVSTLIFGDGAGAALLEPGGDGLRVVGSRSVLLPCSREAIGFDLTDTGFYPRLSLDLADMLPEPTLAAVRALLETRGLHLPDLSYALLHPGGPRILDNLQAALGLPARALRWSQESLAAQGNTSSAAIFDVLRRYLDDPQAPRGWGVVAAFGPGVSIELLLVHRP
ncbi:MAG TPA: hypothetical protein VNN10_02945 [Dehalococcoidia bacterium]|nr:hypothetical protein [Dehalococcoidia bacterium]